MKNTIKSTIALLLFCTITLLSLPADAAMRTYVRNCLTGSGCVDAKDGALLNDGDGMIVVTKQSDSTYPNQQFLYTYDADAGCTESLPTYIVPDSNASSGCWVLGELPSDKVLERMLKAVDTAADEECLTYETTTGDFEWQDCDDLSNNSISELSDVVAMTEVQGDILYHNGTAWTRKAIGTDAQIPISDGTDLNYRTISGDVTIDNAGATTIGADTVALTTDTTGNYAAGDAEAGNATGVACAGSCISDSEVDDDLTISGGTVNNSVIGGARRAEGR